MVPTPDYEILSIPLEDGPARILLSRTLLARAPWLRKELRRVVEAASGMWPESCLLLHESEDRLSSFKEPVFRVPEAYFLRCAGVRSRPLLWWLFDRPFNVEACELARILYRQLVPLLPEDESPAPAGEVLSRVIFGVRSGRAYRTARFVTLSLALAPPTVLYYLWLQARAMLRPRHRGALRDLAAFQYFYSLNSGLAKTKARLAEAGDLAAQLDRYRL
jgi:hypothetical protein